MKNNEEKTTMINLNQNVLAALLIVLILSFVAGFAVGKRVEEDVTIFSREEIERIAEMQRIEDEKGSRAEIFAQKDKEGNLMIGWDYSK